MKGRYLAGEVAEPAAQGYHQLGAHRGLEVQARRFTTRPRATAVRRSVVYRFDWDPVKARANAAKHRVTFRLATSVFRDPLALTIYGRAQRSGRALGDAGAGGQWTICGGDPHVETPHPHGDRRAYRLGPQGDERGNAKLSRTAALAAEGAMMKRQYDFSKGERGKFYNPGAVFKLPVYLDEEVQTYLADKADAKGVELSDLVNEMLKKEIEIIEVVR